MYGKKLVPVAIGAPQMWLKNYVAVSPFEMFKIFQAAEFIITDTFHGTIFSEKFNGHYAVLLRESNKNKLGDLVRKIKAEDHVIPDFNHLNDAYNAFNDRESSKQRQLEERKKSLDYLKQYV